MTRLGNGRSQRVIHNKVAHAPDRIWLQASETFVVTPQIEELAERALAYLDAGYPINLSGPAGTGKTTLALHVASKLGHPVMLIHGDDEFGSSDLVGNETGYRKNRLVDNYIHSVLKEEETMRTLWIDNRLTTACRYGHTLVYDEFTRSRPEANNVLLSVLEEYAGIHKSQDALMDRLIRINVDYYDRDTEVAITARRSDTSEADAARVVDMVRRCRVQGMRGHRPSIRASIMIAHIIARAGASFDPLDPVFQRTSRDVLGLDAIDAGSSEPASAPQAAEADLENACELVGTALGNAN